MIAVACMGCDDAADAPTVIVVPPTIDGSIGNDAARDGGSVDMATPGDSGALDADPAGGDAAPDARMVDARADDGSIAADARRPDAGSPPDMGDGCPPNPLEGEWEGDLHLRAECGVQVFGRPEIDAEPFARINGDLRIDPGVEVHVVRALNVTGNLDAGAGVQVLCVPGRLVGNGSTFLSAGGEDSQIRGTADAPVVFGRLGAPISSQNACHLRRIVGTIKHANFHSVGFLGLGGTIRDSVIDNAHINAPGIGARTWLRARPGSIFEYCRFLRTQMEGEYTVRFSLFELQGADPIIFLGEERCEGMRDQPQTVFAEHNVFDVEDGDEVIRLGREIGPVSFPNNHFVNGVPMDLDVWDVRARGCRDDDLGEWGGRLSLDPIAAEPPAVYGPRR